MFVTMLSETSVMFMKYSKRTPALIVRLRRSFHSSWAKRLSDCVRW